MQSTITNDKWRPTNPFRAKFSLVPTSEDDSVKELEGDHSLPIRSVFYGVGWKITCFSAILSPILLILLIVNSRVSLHTDVDHSTRAIFGDIPWIPRPFHADDRFINEDPYDGQAWNLYKGKAFEFERESTVWDEIYPGNFIAIEDPQKFGLDGGVDLGGTAENATEFAAGTQGFELAFFHQIHCIGVLKHYLFEQKSSKQMTEQQFHHTDHCLEMLRQLVVCKGDLAIQRPKEAHISKDWHLHHVCRDEEALMDAVRSRVIVKTHDGWARRYKQ